MKTAEAALKAMEDITRGSLALTHPKTRETAAARMSRSDESRSPVIDIA